LFQSAGRNSPKLKKKKIVFLKLDTQVQTSASARSADQPLGTHKRIPLLSAAVGRSWQ
jgi:hypothetical protein